MRMFEDTPHHQQLRRRLVQGIQDKGITDNWVLNAINNVPRQFFMDETMEDKAYEDKAFPIAEGQTISQPYTVAYQSELLHVKPGDKVLEIGTGSAYQAAILAAMGAEVFTIERQKKLFDSNKNFHYLRRFSNIHFFFGDGYEGLPRFAPFDKVIITAAAPEVPPKLVQQLKPGGMMVLPIGKGEVQRMMRITKKTDGGLLKEYFDNFSFVPMLSGREE